MIQLTAKNLAGEVSDSRWDFQYVEHKKKEEGDLSGAGYSGQNGPGTNNGQYQENERKTVISVEILCHPGNVEALAFWKL